MARSFFTSLRVEREYAEKTNNKETLLILDWIEDWMISTPFSSYKKVKTVLKNYGASNRDLALLLGVAEKTAKDARLSVSKELFGLFGSDFFHVLRDNSEQAKKDIKNRINFVRSQFGLDNLRPDLLVQIRSVPANPVVLDSIKVSDCADELRFLKVNTTSSLSEGLSKLDMQKLHFLLELIEGNRGTQSDRVRIAKFLEGGK